MTPDDLSERLLDFAARIGNVVEGLPDKRLARHIAGQLIRCGTSPAANYDEGCGAESVDDFIHKVGIAFKELRESRVWIRLIIKAELLSKQRMAAVHDECEQLCRILAKSLVTAKTNRNKRRER